MPAACARPHNRLRRPGGRGGRRCCRHRHAAGGSAAAPGARRSRRPWVALPARADAGGGIRQLTDVERRARLRPAPAPAPRHARASGEVPSPPRSASATWTRTALCMSRNPARSIAAPAPASQRTPATVLHDPDRAPNSQDGLAPVSCSHLPHRWCNPPSRPFLAAPGAPCPLMPTDTRRKSLGKARMPFGSRAQCARITRLIPRGHSRVCSDTRTRIPRQFACRGFPADRPASCALSQDTPGPSGPPQAPAAPPGRREAPDGARPRFRDVRRPRGVRRAAAFGEVGRPCVGRKREGGLHAEVEVGRLLLRFGGVVVRGVARDSPLAPAAAVEFVALAGGVLPAALASGAALS